MNGKLLILLMINQLCKRLMQEQFFGSDLCKHNISEAHTEKRSWTERKKREKKLPRQVLT